MHADEGTTEGVHSRSQSTGGIGFSARADEQLTRSFAFTHAFAEISANTTSFWPRCEALISAVQSACAFGERLELKIGKNTFKRKEEFYAFVTELFALTEAPDDNSSNTVAVCPSVAANERALTPNCKENANQMSNTELSFYSS